MNPIQLPTSFKKRIINTFDNKGKTWLNNLPAIIIGCEKRFNIEIKNSLPHLSFNYTAEAVQADGQKLIVKLCVPNDGVYNEINALEFMRGDGIVKLIDSDRERGILLLEQLIPGEMLSTLNNDAEATMIAADIIKKIRNPISDNHNFPTTEQWFDRLEKPIELPAGFPAELINRVKKIASELHKNKGESVLLHGDLHHFNILSARRQPWIAIDPKGIVGPPEYECGAFLRNPIPDIANHNNIKSILARRVAIFSETLGFDKQVIIGWGFSQAILASVWCMDMKSKDWRIFLTCADALFELFMDKRL